MTIKVLGDLKALGKKKSAAKSVEPGTIASMMQKVGPAKKTKTKPPAQEVVAAPTPPPEPVVTQPVQVKTSANPKASASPTGKLEVTITLPLVQETPAYLGVTHEDKT